MSDEKPIPSPTEQFNGTEGTILLLLTTDDHWMWSVEEVIREYGDRGAAIDAINNLHGAGLIHRTTDDFVFATRAAVRAGEIHI